MKLSKLRAGAPIVLAFVLAIGLICLANGARRIGETFPGFLLADNRIVLSIGRSGWSLEKAERILFAKVMAVGGRPIGSTTELEAQISGLAEGTPVTYRFRKHADVFTAVVGIQRFGLDDFLALYATYFLAGLSFALAGFWATRQAHHVAAETSFFALCETVALVLFTGGDVAGPYWFTPLYFTAQCIAPAAILHFASSYPEPLMAATGWRRGALVVLYAVAAGLGVALNLAADDPSLFLPLVYTLYLLLANALLLYVARLLIGLWSVSDVAVRRSLRLALATFLLSATIPGVIFVIYPALKRPISPTLLVAPLVMFPPLTGLALRRAGQALTVPLATSARARLALLFLGAVETAFLAALGTFWLDSSWNQLIDERALNTRRTELVDRAFRHALPVTGDVLGGLEVLVQTVSEQQLVHIAGGSDTVAGRAALTQLGQACRATAARLEARRQRLGRFGAALVIGLVVAGIAQAVAFMVAVRRWLIRPVERLTAATRVIATGDLGHRVAPNGAREFVALGESINAMAASLADIQRRIDAEQEARNRAAGAARDVERQRLARELHDGTLQDLSALKLLLEGLAKGAPAARLQPAIDGIIEIIVSLRRVVDDLAPELSHVALGEAVSAYARILAGAHEVGLRTDLAADVSVPEWASRDVYRIAQESLTNAVRHGAPTNLVVRLYRDDGHTVLEVQDDGAGFDPNTAALGTGIRGMRERAAAIGATLRILSTPRRGTTVQLSLPAASTRPKGGLPQGEPIA